MPVRDWYPSDRCAMNDKEHVVGLFGGSFDPVHNGHLAAARTALAFGRLDRVIFIPASVSPFKQDDMQAAGVHRLEMLRLATASEPRMCISDVEILQSGVSYTIDTVRHFLAVLPGVKLFFIIGADALVSLHQWKEVQTLVRLCDFITLSRSGSRIDALPELDERIAQRLLNRVVHDFNEEVSSTEIRKRVGAGLSVVDYVHRDVERYIVKHGLYQKSGV